MDTPRAIPRLPHFHAWLRSIASSQAKQAAILGVSTRCVEYWESGKRWPSVSALRRCPDALRALADDLEGKPVVKVPNG